MLKKILLFILKSALRLRYSVTFKGLENLTPDKLNKPGGVVFLPNHPQQLDGGFVAWGVPQFNLRPAAVEYLFQNPVIKFVLETVNAIPIPNLDLCSNNLKKIRVDKVMDEIVNRVKAGDNFLFYPSGRLKLTGVEMIGGASGVHKILQEAPETNIVLVRVNGLWGSSFSRALTGKTPPIMKVVMQGAFHILKNLIFFTPRRKVTVEYFPNPVDFPYQGSRLNINHYLEDFYNQPPAGTTRDTIGEPLTRVSYSMWSEVLPPLPESPPEEDYVDLDRIPADIKKDVLKEIANLANKAPSEIKPSTHLATDLGLDSLDATELLIFLEDQYGITGLYPSDLTTTATIMAIASKQKVIFHEEEEETEDFSSWAKVENRPPTGIPDGDTVQEIFLRCCDRMGKSYACVDNVSGMMTYADLKMRAILIAEKIKKLEGERIGILLPASAGAQLVIFATLLAGKVPVMLNWTVGRKHLQHVLEITEVERIITSWRFLDQLENTDLGDIEDKLCTLEKVREEISIFDKLGALYRSKQSVDKIMKHFGLDKKTEDDPAVILFTSGTESLPKGVPLSNKNIISNIRAVLQTIEVATDDVIFATLPPFHSMGFCVTGLFPLLSGMKVAYSPDPTNSAALARGIARWGITLYISAPSFLKAVLKVATQKQLESLRLIVVGSEKTPQELFDKVANMDADIQMIEGYGITECAPALTMNIRGKEKVGVGPAFPGVELCIIHIDTHEVLPSGEVGLILANGPNIFGGYLKHDGASPFIEMDGKTWYNTGDLGFLDEDKNLTLAGRLKRFVKIGAEMISLGAVEDALINEASIRDWPRPEEGPAFVVCAIEPDGEKPQLILLTSSFLTLRDANDALKNHGLSNLYRLSHIKQLDAIPLTGTGKIDYRNLQDLVKKEFVNA